RRPGAWATTRPPAARWCRSTTACSTPTCRRGRRSSWRRRTSRSAIAIRRCASCAWCASGGPISSCAPTRPRPRSATRGKRPGARSKIRANIDVTSAAPDLTGPSCRTSLETGGNYCPRCGASLREGVPVEVVELDPLVGRLIDGRYRVLERVGTGGMGVVYKVEHQRMGKLAAMKVLHGDLAKDREVMKRFRREAEAGPQLTHPNAVQTFDFGTTADGALYLVMELVRGEDLGSILKRDGPLPFRRAAPIFLQICGALGEAHELGIIHRDLKPENILVSRTKDGLDHIKVLDFGLAKLSEREEWSEVTGKGEFIGTPYYMPPEQIRGEALDKPSDLYSLGALMYRVLAGQPVFTAKTPVGVLTKHISDDPIPLAERAPVTAEVEAGGRRRPANRPEGRAARAGARA